MLLPYLDSNIVKETDDKNDDGDLKSTKNLKPSINKMTQSGVIWKTV